METKFNIGDFAVAFNANKLAIVHVRGIEVSCFGTTHHVLFGGNDDSQTCRIKEQFLFRDVNEVIHNIERIRKDGSFRYGNQKWVSSVPIED